MLVRKKLFDVWLGSRSTPKVPTTVLIYSADLLDLQICN